MPHTRSESRGPVGRNCQGGPRPGRHQIKVYVPTHTVQAYCYIRKKRGRK